MNFPPADPPAWRQNGPGQPAQGPVQHTSAPTAAGPPLTNGGQPDGYPEPHDAPLEQLRPTPWHERPAGKWIGAVAAWAIGVAAGVQQIVQSIVAGPNAYGYFFAALAIIVGLVLMGYSFGSTKRGTIGQYLVVLVAIIPLVLGWALAGYQYSSTSVRPPAPSLAVSITKPVANAEVDHTIPVSGVVENLPPDKQIWIVATGRMDGDLQVPYQFYVQPGPCIYANDGFTCPDVHVGVAGGDTSRYELIPVIADKSQEKAFTECLADLQHQLGCAPVRPDGIQLGSGVFVKRR